MQVRPTGLLALCAAVILPCAGPVQAEAPVVPIATVNAVALAQVPGIAPGLQQAPETTAPAAPDQTSARPIAGGVASFYGRRFAGARTASGARYAPDAMTAAHRTLPFGTKLQVTNPRNGESVVVTVNDRGPFHGNRVLDLSDAAAEELGIVRAGSGRVELAVLDN